MKKLITVAAALAALSLGLVACGNTAHVEVERLGGNELSICVYHTGMFADYPGDCQPNDVVDNATLACSKEYETQPGHISELSGGNILVECRAPEGKSPPAPSSPPSK